MADCPTCFPISCPDTDDQNLYSIESPIYPWVLNCPPGFDCNEASEFHMFCCGKLLQTFFPPDATIDDKMVLINDIVNECATRQLFCGDIPNVPGNPNTPIQLYYSIPKSCQIKCPDGTTFTYFVPAGSFVDTTQALADQRASEFACQQAALRRICLGNIPGCTCKGSVYSAVVTETGGVGPFVWSIQSGALPDGLSLNHLNGAITGTCTLEGTYSADIRVTSLTDGSYNQKRYFIVVLTISNTSLPAYTIGTPYSYQLVAAGGSGNYAFKITAGSLPAGLSMDINGLITGTPV